MTEQPPSGPPNFPSQPPYAPQPYATQQYAQQSYAPQPYAPQPYAPQPSYVPQPYQQQPYQQQAYVQPDGRQLAGPPSANRFSKGQRWAAAVLGIGVVAAIGIGVSMSGSGGPKGYNDPDTLAAAIQVQGNENLTDGTTITNVTCVHVSGTQFTCNATGSDGSTATVTATVSKDGSTWITSGASGS
jgi:hypothetical protein